MFAVAPAAASLAVTRRLCPYPSVHVVQSRSGNDHEARGGAEPHLHNLIERFQRVLPALVALAAEPTTRLPDLVQATDAVSVVLAADGLPLRIEVNPEWRRAAGARDFAQVVTDVCHRAAMAHADAVAGAMSASRWTERVADMLDRLTGETPPPPGASSGVAAAVAVPAGSSRSLPAIVADLVQASASVDDVAAAVREPSAAPVVGSGGRGRLVLLLDGSGTVSCSADPDWVAACDVHELNAAFAAAVAQLRAARDAGTAAPQRLMSTNAELAADLQALMVSRYGHGSANG
jgi:hypothetical protein